MGQLILTIMAMVCTLGSAFAYDDIYGPRFVGCYDGDTCTFNIENLPDVFGYKLPVRLTGLDTPEMKGRCLKEKQTARQARTYVVGLLSAAKTIRFERPFRDKYFRLNVTVFADGVNINEQLVVKGYAVRYNGGKKTKNWCA